MAFRAAPLSSGRIVPRVTIGIVMVIGKEKCYDGHPTLISGHNIIAVWYLQYSMLTLQRILWLLFLLK